MAHQNTGFLSVGREGWVDNIERERDREKDEDKDKVREGDRQTDGQTIDSRFY